MVRMPRYGGVISPVPLNGVGRVQVCEHTAGSLSFDLGSNPHSTKRFRKYTLMAQSTPVSQARFAAMPFPELETVFDLPCSLAEPSLRGQPKETRNPMFMPKFLLSQFAASEHRALIFTAEAAHRARISLSFPRRLFAFVLPPDRKRSRLPRPLLKPIPRLGMPAIAPWRFPAKTF